MFCIGFHLGIHRIPWISCFICRIPHLPSLGPQTTYSIIVRSVFGECECISCCRGCAGEFLSEHTCICVRISVAPHVLLCNATLETGHQEKEQQPTPRILTLAFVFSTSGLRCVIEIRAHVVCWSRPSLCYRHSCPCCLLVAPFVPRMSVYARCPRTENYCPGLALGSVLDINSRPPITLQFFANVARFIHSSPVLIPYP